MSYRIHSLADPDLTVVERDSVNVQQSLTVLCEFRFGDIDQLGVVVGGLKVGLFDDNGLHIVCCCSCGCGCGCCFCERKRRVCGVRSV